MKRGKNKTPNLNRNAGLKRQLNQSLFNFNSEWVDTSNAKTTRTKFNCIDLFAGAGGISCGFDMAGLNTLLGVEIDPIASDTFRNNFPDAKQYCGDIKQLSVEKLKEIIGDEPIHVITGGFPCQGFSVAGYRNPNDKRNVLYQEVVRIVKELKPWCVILENVPGVITMKGGEVYRAILKDFADIGYPNMSAYILEAADYGVPQLRTRTIFVANRFGLPNYYPKPQFKPETYVPIESAIDDLKSIDPNPLINHEWTKHSKKMEKELLR